MAPRNPWTALITLLTRLINMDRSDPSTLGTDRPDAPSILKSRFFLLLIESLIFTWLLDTLYRVTRTSWLKVERSPSRAASRSFSSCFLSSVLSAAGVHEENKSPDFYDHTPGDGVRRDTRTYSNQVNPTGLLNDSLDMRLSPSSMLLISGSWVTSLGMCALPLMTVAHAS